MKKLVAIIAVISVLLTSCENTDRNKENNTNSENNSKTTDVHYIDGSYTAKWEDYVDGWQEFVTLEIKDDVVTVLQYDAVNESGNFISTNEEADALYKENNEKFGLPLLNNKEKFDDIISNFYKGDKDTNQMECVAGATRSTDRFKLLVDKILTSSASTGNSEIQYVNFYGDGVYTVEEGAFNSGWKDFVEITVTDGVPRISRYDSYNEDGKLKSEDEDLKARMIAFTKNKKTGEIYPEKYGEELTKRFNSCNNKPEEIENVVGATISSDIFKVLAERALYNASIRGKTMDSLDKYKDGKYHAEMSVYVDGWKDYIDIEIVDDVIYVKEFNSVNVMGKKKTDDQELKAAMMNGNALNNLPETCPEKYIGDIVSAFTRSNSEILDMENVSGATVSTNNFKIMMGEILRKCAIDGKTHDIVVAPYED